MFLKSLLTILSCQLFKVSTFQNLNNVPRVQRNTPIDRFIGLGAVSNKNEVQFTKEALELLDAIQSKERDDISLVVGQIAPSVRVAIPEVFGREPGSLPIGQLIASLRQVGFDLVLDTNTGADLTICEEGMELLQRIKGSKMDQAENTSIRDSNMKHLPLFTSCCPGWLNMVQKSVPELIPYISTCKSPHMMYGALVKEYSQEMFGLPADKVYFCSIMPCVRKRGESDHLAFIHDGIRDIDNVITTKDLGMILQSKDIDPYILESVPFDSPFAHLDGTGSGAGQLFGATGGVMEAAVRTVYELVKGKPMERLELDDVRGLDGVKEATIHDLNLHVAVANGLGNAKKLLQKIKSGEMHYDFVEVMACPGGCIGGGGQPQKGDLKKRIECIYKLDKALPRRKSHENPVVKRIYADFLGEYGSEKAHELLHIDPIYGEREDNNGVHNS